MKRKIAIFTGTRAEYGLLYWLMKDIQSNAKLTLQIIASGTHLSPEFGLTCSEIEEAGFTVDSKIEMLLSSDTSVGVAKSLGLGTIGYADALARLLPDVLVVLGDRYEALAIAQTALIMRIPIAHLHGGEITEGAYDDSIRHAITKMANLHFVAAEPYRRRVIQMGEDPNRVFNVGALGLDHQLRTPLMPILTLGNSLNFELRAPYFLVTYHPATLTDEDPASTVHAILEALNLFPNHQVIFTYPNADNGGRSIIPIIEEYTRNNPGRAIAISSMGFSRYLSAMNHAAAVVGNSSSGIIEAPMFGVPTVNVGSRQLGRLCADSVLHCKPETQSISEALRVAVSKDFIDASKTAKNPYGQGNSAAQIIDVLTNYQITYQKKFIDLEMQK